MSSTASKEHLDNYLTTLAEIVQELVPQPFDVALIESKVKRTWDLLCTHATLHDKLWIHLENILISDLSDTIKFGYLEKFYERFIKQYSVFRPVYTTKSISPYYNEGKLYTSSQAYDNAAAAVGMIENDKHILVLFNEHYSLPFPAPIMDWESVVMTNMASPVYKELFKTLVRIKPDWDKLADYKSKLAFWFKNGLSIDHFTYFLTEDDATKDLPENRITIYPFEKEEIPVWKRFYYDNFNKYNFNTLETSKAKYDKYIKEGADPIPLTKKIIEQIGNEYKTHDKIKQYEFRLYCVGYNASQNGQINVFLDNGYRPNNPYYMREFCTGVVHEKYNRYLRERLNKLENNNQVTRSMDTKPQSKDFAFIYFLRRYIDMAVRWNIAPSTLMVLQWSYDNARKEVGKFIQEFRTQKLSLNDIEKGNLYVDLKGEFYPMIDMYIEFYNKNEADIKRVISEPYPLGQSPYSKEINPYSVLFDLCNDTKKAIEVLNLNNSPRVNKGNETILLEPVTIVRPNHSLNLEKSLTYINSIEDFEVLTELGRETGKDISFKDFKEMCSNLVSVDEILEMGMKLKRENENLTILMKPVSVKEVLKRFLIECKNQFGLANLDFIQWLDKREFYWRKFQKEKVEELNGKLKNSDSKINKKVEQAKSKYIALCNHFYEIIELVKNEILNNTVPADLPKGKRKTQKLITYKWQSNPDKEVPALYNKMKGKFIDNETTLVQFTSVFSGQATDSITPLKWIAAKNLLAYFIDLIRTNNKVALNTELWAIAKKCFVGANNLSQSRDLYLNSKKQRPKNYHLIDELF